MSRVAIWLVASLAWVAGCSESEEDGTPDAGGLEPATLDVAPDAPGLSETEGDDASASDTVDADGPPERPRSLPLRCWLPPDSHCDVRSPHELCEETETCDLMLTAEETLRIQCLPDEGGASAGEACDNRAGLHCGPGLHCFEDSCERFCCDDQDCAPGGYCEALLPDLGSLGVCLAGTRPAPSCGGRGAFCRDNVDCCSSFCHIDHCH